MPVAGSASPPEVCISPGLSTTVLFDRPLAKEAVVLEGRERFQRMDVAGSVLVLVPSEKLTPGQRLQLKVRFGAAEAPESATFVLVVHRDEADRQVEVSRPSRPTDSCQTELQRKEAELQRCLSAGERAPASSEQQASLAALIANEIVDEKGIATHKLAPRQLPPAQANAPQVTRVTLYRSRARLVVAVELTVPDGMKPWQGVGASLLRPSGEALQRPWLVQLDPIESGYLGSVWVEVEVPSDGARGSYTLVLWDEGKARTLTIPDLKWP